MSSLATSARQKVLLWDVEGKQRACLSGHDKAVNALAFSSDGRTLASGGSDGVVRLWDVQSGKEVAAFDWQVGKVHAVSFAPDGMRAAAGGDANIVLWDLDDGR